MCALEESLFPSDRISRRRFLDLLKTPERTPVFVARDKEGVLGYVLLFFRKNSRWARVYSLAVSEPFQGKGLGKSLMEQAKKCARAHHALGLRLEVRKADTHVVSFYQRFGFEIEKELPSYYEDGADGLRMAYSFNNN